MSLVQGMQNLSLTPVDARHGFLNEYFPQQLSTMMTSYADSPFRLGVNYSATDTEFATIVLQAKGEFSKEHIEKLNKIIDATGSAALYFASLIPEHIERLLQQIPPLSSLNIIPPDNNSLWNRRDAIRSSLSQCLPIIAKKCALLEQLTIGIELNKSLHEPLQALFKEASKLTSLTIEHETILDNETRFPFPASLTWLELRKCFLRHDELQDLGVACPELQTLVLEDFGMTGANNKLDTMIQKMKKLRVLHFQGTYGGVLHQIGTIAFPPSVKAFSFDFWSRNPDSNRNLIQHLCNNGVAEQLQKLTVKPWGISDGVSLKADAVKLLQNFKELEEFDAGAADIDKASEQALWQLKKTNPKLRKVIARGTTFDLTASNAVPNDKS